MTDVTNQAVFAETIKVALYGEAGRARKTLQIASLVETFGAKNVRIISCEGGLTTIGTLLKQHPQIVRRTSGRTPTECFDSFLDACKWVRGELTRADQFAVVDGGSRVMEWIHSNIFGAAQAALEDVLDGTARNKLNQSDPEFGNLRRAAIFITKQENLDTQLMWIRLGQEANRLLTRWTQMPFSFYWNFWEAETQIDQYRKGLPMQPDAPGNGAKDAIVRAFDFIFRLVDEGERDDDGHAWSCAYHHSTPRETAKAREDWAGGLRLPDVTRRFELGKFVRWMAAQTKATDETAAAAATTE